MKLKARAYALLHLPPSPPAEKATARQERAGKKRKFSPTAIEGSVASLRLDDVDTR
jgi:hypothetical protein